MRNLAIAAAILSLAIAGHHHAFAQELPPAPQAKGVQEPSAIRSVTVRDIGTLPPEVRTQVSAVVSQASQDDLRKLRDAIDAMPMAAIALKAKGMSSAEIIAAAFDDDGELTLIAREMI